MKGKELKYGYGVTHTLEETAQLMGVTRECVRQIEKRALEKSGGSLNCAMELQIWRVFCSDEDSCEKIEKDR